MCLAREKGGSLTDPLEGLGDGVLQQPLQPSPRFKLNGLVAVVVVRVCCVLLADVGKDVLHGEP